MRSVEAGSIDLTADRDRARGDARFGTGRRREKSLRTPERGSAFSLRNKPTAVFADSHLHSLYSKTISNVGLVYLVYVFLLNAWVIVCEHGSATVSIPGITT